MIKKALADKNDHDKATMLAAIEIQRRAKLVKDLIKHIVFFIVFLTVIILQKDSNYVYQIGQSLKTDLQFTGTGTNDAYTAITTQDQFNAYLTGQLAPQIASMSFANPYSMNSIIGGTMRIRQMRVRKDSCPTLGLNITCYSPTYDSSTRETQDIVGTNGTVYEFSHHTGDPMVFGYNQYSYEPTGYYIDIPITNAQAGVQGLIDNTFFNYQTRAVIISFVTYTINYESRVTVAYLLLEYSASGTIEPYYSLRTYRTNMYTTPLDRFRGFLEILFLASFILYVVFLSNRNSHSSQIDTVGYPTFLEALGQTALVYYQLSAINILLLAFKTFRYLVIHRRLYALWITLSHARVQLMTFTVMFLIMMIGFLISGWLTFGHDEVAYFGFINSLGTSLQFIMGNPPNFQTMTYTNRALGPIYTLLFIIFMFLILFNMFVAIISNSYSEVINNINSKQKKNIYDVSTLVQMLMEKKPDLLVEKGLTPEKVFEEIQNLGLGFKYDEAQYYTDLLLKVNIERKKFLQGILANKSAAGTFELKLIGRHKILRSVKINEWAEEQEKQEKKKEKQRYKETQMEIQQKVDRLLQLLGDATYLMSVSSQPNLANILANNINNNNNNNNSNNNNNNGATTSSSSTINNNIIASTGTILSSGTNAPPARINQSRSNLLQSDQNDDGSNANVNVLTDSIGGSSGDMSSSSGSIEMQPM
ncbi:hypothetical protein SAMD00019534_108050 [Acytostelium subglobosum LB1]|uniref:hypothetical protein n=1 Tax=Acytostelium subglobosum LB1 TaxID=1410327 RepID=UPI0006448089|nr:hypothetical protein SAMD00019534_108050 [Acytostelium subglobosum LB1]GAM27629.1 hypothetical protein SAMD00019534_108050 [Acytostelium subglobosum LB1]|eukprot:XP_012749288.1 hypothetical protein SAMD00019534_108050 [Acytostelium subglobosum LB1]